VCVAEKHLALKPLANRKQTKANRMQDSFVK